MNSNAGIRVLMRSLDTVEYVASLWIITVHCRILENKINTFIIGLNLITPKTIKQNSTFVL